MHRPGLALTLSIIFVSSSFAQFLPRLDSLVEATMQQEKIPGMAIAVIESGKVSHLKGYGFRDLAYKAPVSSATPFHIASVSKVITSMAIFKLVQMGKLDLQGDVNQYLPFEIANPHYRDDKITLGELLNHKSGIRDNIKIYKDYWNVPKGDPKMPLSTFLYHYLHEEGDLYSKSHFEKSDDYKALKYSNTGYALLGLIVEYVSGEEFSQFCSKNIFKPLGMKSTGWFLRDFNENEVAKTYAKNKSGEPVFLGHNGYPDYPAGQLRTSIADFVKVLQGLINPDPDFVLSASTVFQILPQMKEREQSYTWFTATLDRNQYYYHSGGDIGVRTMVILNREKGNAAVVFANGVFNEIEFIKRLNAMIFRAGG